MALRSLRVIRVAFPAKHVSQSQEADYTASIGQKHCHLPTQQPLDIRRHDLGRRAVDGFGEVGAAFGGFEVQFDRVGAVGAGFGDKVHHRPAKFTTVYQSAKCSRSLPL